MSTERLTIVGVIDAIRREGGAESSFARLLNALAERGHRIVVLTFKSSPEARSLLAPEIQVQTVGAAASSRGWFAKLRAALSKIIGIRARLEAETPDVCLSFMDQANLICTLAKVGLKVPLVCAERVHPRFSSLLPSRFPGWLNWCIHRLRCLFLLPAKAVVVQTDSVQDAYPSFLRGRFAVIPNPIWPRPLSEQAEFVLERPCVLGLGRLRHQKRFDRLLRAFASASKRHPNWSLRIVGEGPEREPLQLLARTLGLDAERVFPGPTNASHAILEQADIVALSSDYEGFPNVLLEALSVGAAVVSMDAPFGPKDILEGGKLGLLVPMGAGDEGLAASLERLMADDALRQRLAHAGPSVLGRYPPGEIVDRWEGLLRSAALGKGSV